MSSPGSESQFEAPTDDAQQSEETAGATFAVPPATTQGEEAAFAPDPQALSGVSTQLLDAHAAVENALLQQDRAASAVRSMDSLTDGGGDIGNVEGVAIGLGEPGDGPPGQPTLNVYVAEPATLDEVRAVVVDGLGVQAAGDMPITVRQSGKFDAQPHRFRIRPAPGGVSVGHVKITAGTIGCLCVGRSAPRNARLMVLSNNHVLANSNNAAFGDSIIQPGRYDGGTTPADQIAILERFIPIQFGGARNYVDAATGWCWPDRVRRELIYPSGGRYNLFRIGSNPVYPQLGWTVGKSGRTTQLTQGRIVSINWSGYVNYGVGTAFFVGQMVVQAASGNFSAGGDSGSSIWKWEAGLPPTGLLFAGGGGYTIASPMPWVTHLLDVNLYTCPSGGRRLDREATNLRFSCGLTS